MPARPFTRRQHFQNAAFLDALRRTGNARLAAATLGVHRATYTKRRARSAAFATEWDMALAAAHAAFHRAGGARAPENLPGTGRGTARSAVEGPEAKRRDSFHDSLRTRGGEPTVVRTRSGRLQLRLAPPGRMNAAAQQAFFRALSATANIRLSAAAAGFAHSSFYARKRASKAFAREMRLALEMGYDRLEAAALAAALPEDPEASLWRHNDPPPIPPMSPQQALQLLFLHEKSVRQSWDQPQRRKRRGEPQAVYVERLRAMWVVEKAREAEDEALRRAARYERTGDWRFAHEPRSPDLPPLELVTGWSKAKGNPPHDPKWALFGGWRLKDWKKRQGQG
jgi:hypothetical protein